MKRLIALCLLLLPAAPLFAQEKPAEAGKPVVKTRTVRIENGRVRVEENGKVVEDAEVGDAEARERAKSEMERLEAEFRALQRELDRLRRELKEAGGDEEVEEDSDVEEMEEDELPAEVRRELDRARVELKRLPGGVKLPREMEEELRKALEEAEDAEDCEEGDCEDGEWEEEGDCDEGELPRGLKRLPGGVKLPPEMEEELRKALEEAEEAEGDDVQEFEKSAPDGSWHVKIRIVRRGAEKPAKPERKPSVPRKGKISE